MAFNNLNKDFLKLQQDLMDSVYFFHNANSLTLKFEHCLHKESPIAINIGDNQIFYESNIGNG